MNCRICGKTANPEFWMPSVAESMRRRRMCFGCNFWWDCVEEKDKPNSVRCDGLHYWIGDGKGGGYSGRRFVVRFSKGIEVVTTDLWVQGKIPNPFAELLPNNVDYIRDVNTVGSDNYGN